MSCMKHLDEIADDLNVSTAFLMHGEEEMTLENLSPREVTSVSKFQKDDGSPEGGSVRDSKSTVVSYGEHSRALPEEGK